MAYADGRPFPYAFPIDWNNNSSAGARKLRYLRRREKGTV